MEGGTEGMGGEGGRGGEMEGCIVIHILIGMFTHSGHVERNYVS